ncbi:hypothetical protein MNBD_PLANCTO02-3009, partial [hydrothermal vent metagenome]
WNDEHQRVKKAIAEGEFTGDATRILMGFEPHEEEAPQQGEKRKKNNEDQN